MKNYTLINGDCLAEMKLMSDNSIDLTVTSPPYDKLRIYNGYSFDFESIAKELYRITKQGGVVVWVVGDSVEKGSETGNSFRQAIFFKEIGFNIHDTMIYEKNGSSFPEKTRYYQVFEYMFVFSKGKPKTINLINDRKNRWAGTSTFGTRTNRSANGEVIESTSKHRVVKDYGTRWNIWKINTGFGFSTKDKIAFKHPAIFPEQLANDHIVSWSNEGDTVLDCFAGSGTTGKMALLNNRKFIGIEISPEYIEIAKQRINNL